MECSTRILSGQKLETYSSTNGSRCQSLMATTKKAHTIIVTANQIDCTPASTDKLLSNRREEGRSLPPLLINTSPVTGGLAALLHMHNHYRSRGGLADTGSFSSVLIWLVKFFVSFVVGMSMSFLFLNV